MRKLLAGILLAAVLVSGPMLLSAQENGCKCPTPKTKWQSYNEYSRWSIGANIGFPFFTGDFKSAAFNKTYWGIMTDLQLGYQVTPTIGTRLSVGYAQNKAGARKSQLDFFVTPDSYGFYGPVPPEGSLHYGDLYSKTTMWAFNFNVDINVNNLFQHPCRERRWTVLVSPGLYLQKFDPQLYTKDGGQKFGAELWNPFTLGIGADAAVRFKASRAIDLQLRGGINWIHLKSYDGIVATSGQHSHNAMYNVGVGIIWKINGKKHKDALMYAPKFVPSRIHSCHKPAKVSGRIIDTLVVKMVPEVAPQEKVVIVTKKVFCDLPSVHFQRGSAIIDQERYSPELDCIVKTLKDVSDVDIEIYGYADHTGNAQINNPLSYDRAKALREYLIAHGISSSRIKGIHGMGADETLSGNDAYSVRARRAEVVK